MAECNPIDSPLNLIGSTLSSFFHHQPPAVSVFVFSLPGSSGPGHTRLPGTHSLSSRTWGSSRWGSGWHGCTQPAERCTRCWNTWGPLPCTHTACSGPSPGSTIPPRSKCCRCPRRCFPAAPPPKSQQRRVRKAAVPKWPCAPCALRQVSHRSPWLLIDLIHDVQKEKLVLKVSELPTSGGVRGGKPSPSGLSFSGPLELRADLHRTFTSPGRGWREDGGERGEALSSPDIPWGN